MPQNDNSGAMASKGTFPDYEDTAAPTRIPPCRHKGAPLTRSRCEAQRQPSPRSRRQRLGRDYVPPRALPQLPVSGTGQGRDHCVIIICFKKHTEVTASSFQLLWAGFAISELTEHVCDGHRQKDLIRGSYFCYSIEVLSE